MVLYSNLLYDQLTTYIRSICAFKVFDLFHHRADFITGFIVDFDVRVRVSLGHFIFFSIKLGSVQLQRETRHEDLWFNPL